MIGKKIENNDKEGQKISFIGENQGQSKLKVDSI